MPEKGASRACPLFSRRCPRPVCSRLSMQDDPAPRPRSLRGGRAGTSSRKPPTPRSSPRSARSRQASGTSSRARREARGSGVRGSPARRAGSAVRARARSGSSHSATRTRRSRVPYISVRTAETHRAHIAQARPLEPCRARPLRARRGPARTDEKGGCRRPSLRPGRSERSLSGTSRLPDHPVTGWVDGARCAAASASRPNTANARITSPMPVKSSATPTTMPKTASRSACCDVERRRERSGSDPGVARRVRDGIAFLVLEGGLLVARARGIVRFSAETNRPISA